MAYLIAQNRRRQLTVRLNLPEGRAVVGRSRRADLVIPDRSVSKIHCSIEPLGGGRWRLRDLDSKNGIIIRGRRHPHVVVGAGTELRLGDVFIAIRGVGPATLPIPDAVPRPRPRESTGADDPSVHDPRQPGRGLDRWGIPVLVLLAVSAAISGWVLPEWVASGRGTPEPASSPSNASPAAPAARETRGAPGAEAAAEDSEPRTGPSPSSTADLPHSVRTDGERARLDRPPAELGPGPGDSAPPIVAEEWHALADELDTTCGEAACHWTRGPHFVRAGDPEPGRWERALLELRDARRLEEGGHGLRLVALGGRAPHDRVIELQLGEAASRGAKAVVHSTGRLIVPRVAAEAWEELAGPDLAQELRVVRAWRLLYGRAPSADEVLAQRSGGLAAWLEVARRSAEFWRHRARRALGGRIDPRAGLPASLLPAEVPRDLAHWAGMLRAELARFEGGGAVARTPAPGDPPLPNGADDRLLDGWFRSEMASSEPVRLSAAGRLRSIWTLLLGAPPRLAEDRLLRALSAAPALTPEEAAFALAETILAGPSSAIPAPRPGREEQWCGAVGALFLGHAVTRSARSQLAAAVASGALDPLLILRVLATSAELAGRASPATDLAASAPRAVGSAAPGSLRMEVICDFPVRTLLRERRAECGLDALLGRSELTLFESADSTVLESMRRSSRRTSPGEWRVFADLAIARGLAPGVSRHELDVDLLADGALDPSLRSLFDLLGEPQVSLRDIGLERWVGRVLRAHTIPLRAPVETPSGTRPTARTPNGIASGGLLAACAFRLQADGWRRSLDDAVTRSLDIADELLARGESSVATWFTLGAGERGAGVAWSRLATRLELLEVRHPGSSFDLWLWGPRADGTGSDPFRIRWGGGRPGSWVTREHGEGWRFHPAAGGAHPVGEASLGEDRK